MHDWGRKFTDRERAWQLTYEAVRQRAGAGTVDDWRAEIEKTIREADSQFELVNQVVGFSATLAQYFGRQDKASVLSLMSALDQSVMGEGDGPESL
ncbi:hypothetical protein BOO86_27845 [Mycobacterium sp. CBMA 234]|uniref:hypothetical protein n=1 Tax=Mycolicibacterium sp. CBMA 234 TaxID=1918495 RepID=UPI0012DED63C|nr:hypothetical protein [Mycolicibacterium sp. CBMA 234]MUL68312.1 hypothetical protein [Mycolicibacterium sp. CBMA 234]